MKAAIPPITMARKRMMELFVRIVSTLSAYPSVANDKASRPRYDRWCRAARRRGVGLRFTSVRLQGGPERRPFDVDPTPDHHNRGDHSDQHHAKQNGIFNERSSI